MDGGQLDEAAHTYQQILAWLQGQPVYRIDP